jgi:hypothetical protein
MAISAVHAFCAWQHATYSRVIRFCGMSKEFGSYGTTDPGRIARLIRLEKVARKEDAVGASLRRAFDDDEAETEPVPDEFVSLLQMLH